MKYDSFLKERGSNFRRVIVKQGDGVVCIGPRGAIYLTSHVWTLAEGPLDQRLVKDLGGYGVMHGHCDIKPLVEFRWKIDRWNELRVMVQYVKDALGRTFICLQRGSRGWFAVARINQPENALLLKEFFSTRRRHDGQGFGFCASKGVPARITNYRPELLDKETIVNMYGHWLRWTGKLTGRRALYYGAWQGEVTHGVGKEESDVVKLRKSVADRIVNCPLARLEKPKVGATVPPQAAKPPRDFYLPGVSGDEARQWYRDGYDHYATLQIDYLRKKGELEAARDLVQRIIVVVSDKPEALASHYMTLGLINVDLVDYETASLAYRRALALEPKDEMDWYYAHNNLGFCLNQIHQSREAEQFLRQAIEIKPEWFNAYRNLGISLSARAEYAEAAKMFVKATILAPFDTRALEHLEWLLDEHEIVYLQVPEIRADLEKCRRLVRKKGAA